MALVKCNACGAEYRTVLRDGSTYFHACAPLVIVKARKDDGTEIEQPLDQFTGLTLVETKAERDELVAKGTVPAASIVVVRSRRLVKREGHRDENTRAREGDRGERRILKSEGAGCTTLKTDQQLAADDADAV